MIRRLLLALRRVAAQFGSYAKVIRRMPCAVCYAGFYRSGDEPIATYMEVAQDTEGEHGLPPDCHAIHAGVEPNRLVPLCFAHVREDGRAAWIDAASLVAALLHDDGEPITAALPALAARLRRIYSTLSAPEES